MSVTDDIIQKLKEREWEDLSPPELMAERTNMTALKAIVPALRPNLQNQQHNELNGPSGHAGDELAKRMFNHYLDDAGQLFVLTLDDMKSMNTKDPRMAPQGGIDIRKSDTNTVNSAFAAMCEGDLVRLATGLQRQHALGLRRRRLFQLHDQLRGHDHGGGRRKYVEGDGRFLRLVRPGPPLGLVAVQQAGPDPRRGAQDPHRLRPESGDGVRYEKPEGQRVAGREGCRPHLRRHSRARFDPQAVKGAPPRLAGIAFAGLAGEKGRRIMGPTRRPPPAARR
ncbi:MAG TPA: hypothetical protein VMS17_21570 [Gemmataceae bacterium]|nr:hypothetical protein [Gemmataceae bacterium]